MVAQRFLETLVAAPHRFEVTVLGEEPRPAYDRVHLSEFFAGRSADDLSVTPPDFMHCHGITLRLGVRAVALDRDRRLVTGSDGVEYPYDRLVLATGSSAFVPPIPGRDRAGCFVYRSIEDLEAIRASATQARSGAVIGGGLLGLEAAKALKDLGLETHVVEFAPRLMAVQVDEAGGRLLREKIEGLGVGVHVGRNTREIVAGGRARHCLNFVDGAPLEVDVVLFSAGIRPRDELARAAGLEVGGRGGVVIDERGVTSDPAILAIGECACHAGRVYGLVAPGYRMADVAAATLTGRGTEVFQGADQSTRLKLLGVEVASIGDAHAATPGARSLCFSDERRGTYKKLVMSGDCSRLLGAVMVGDAAEYGEWLQMMLNALPLPEAPETLLVPAGALAAKPAGAGVAALPATATVCSCNNVTKGALCAAIEGGAMTLGALQQATRAATACGGCAPLVTQLLKAELAARGVGVDNGLCEHFPYSRQQLFHLVRVGRLAGFDALLQKHGRGRGCDVCKPTIASILASCWNGYVLQPEQAALQDTNDRFLANIQKDGTYSIVPRIPGGEITPEKLIVIGEIARRYRLYTKITGGQRIDLFGAQLHELPQIWRELVAAGFESGHAYGKSVRTVKSCVGSTWCRYGVQDSVGMAIRLEHRYKGIRAPHKLKFAVSGCTRECAEAQGKDIGVIATEQGWNLYVCGNGGMKPRHADLLARDLDDATLTRFIDRVLMFYIRTADRLQRTSTWLDNLEGGIDYLRAVVCEDSLGIGAELEADMARLVAAYECEWRKAVQDPQSLRRFRQFVNSERGDERVVFVHERRQIRPATAEERQAAMAAQTGVEATA